MAAETLEELIALCKRRGFVFPGSELYGGLQGTYDYGPLGVELKNQLKQAWWRVNVYERDDIEGLDSSILTHRLVLFHSGHEATFADPLVDNRITKKRYRLDHLLKEQSSRVLEALAQALSTTPSPSALAAALLKDPERAEQLLKSAKVVDPHNGAPGDWTPPRPFNMMFRTQVGPVEDEASYAYLRPETAQGIFINFKNVLDTTSRKLPFGIAQIGKAFRNEITPRNFLFRVREFEQMEIEYFVEPGTDEHWHQHWLEARLRWWEAQGLPREKIRVIDVPPEDLAHYSKRTFDLAYQFPTLGFEEIEGIANRTDFDLGSHTRGQSELSIQARVLPNEDSTARLAVQDAAGRWVVPFVIEPSAGVDRGFLAILSEAYQREQLDNGSERIVLKLKPHLAPIKAAVVPLARNRPPLVEQARAIWRDLKSLGLGRIHYEDTGNIGKAYRRHDEVGTPYVITVDYDTLGQGERPELKGTVTVRDRDNLRQERLAIEELGAWLRERLAAR